MPRPIRHVREDHYYLLTNRCLLGQFVMVPDDECRRIIKGCLARAAAAHDVELVCFVFLSNHFHIIARFPRLNMSEFMGQLQGQIAGRLNNLRDRDAPVFPYRFDDQALLDEAILRDKIAYVLNNPVKDQLVSTAEDWPGVTSMRLHCEENSTLEGRWLNHTEWRKYRRRKDDYDRSVAMEHHDVELHYPHALAGDGADERRRSLVELVEQDRNRLHREWSAESRPDEVVVGADAIVEQFDWWDRPDEPPDSGRRHLGVASEADEIRAYHERRRKISENYRRTSADWPECRLEDFPHGTYPPGEQHCVGSPAAG